MTNFYDDPTVYTPENSLNDDTDLFPDYDPEVDLNFDDQNQAEDDFLALEFDRLLQRIQVNPLSLLEGKLCVGIDSNLAAEGGRDE